MDDIITQMYRFVIILAMFCNVLASNLSTYQSSLPKNYQHQSKAGIRYNVGAIEINPYKDFDTSGFDFTVDANLDLCENIFPFEEYDNFVVVYPEYCVTSNLVVDNRTLARQMSQVIPEPDGTHTPCGGGSEANERILARFSCIAQQKQIYVVSHFIEQEECTDCAEDNLRLYSTAVAFDRNGTIVAKYRKFHMYDETALDAAESAQISTFTSDFGVTFGLLMSFDLMFESPAMELTSNVTEILVPFAWSGVMPFLSPVQIFNGWSIINNNNNLMTGCYLKPTEGYTGCGMFFHDGDYVLTTKLSDMWLSDIKIASSTSVNKQLKSDSSLPKYHGDINFKSENMTEYSAEKLKTSIGFTEMEVCHNSLCCQLKYQISEFPFNIDDFHYHLLVFDGVNKHSNGRTGWKTQVCGLVGCNEDTIESCGDMLEIESYRYETHFTKLSLSGNFNSSYIIPSLMTANFSPYSSIDLNTEIGIDGKFNVTLSLDSETAEIYNMHTFGLYSGVLGVEE